MSVYKRLHCHECNKYTRETKENRKPSVCPYCGARREYSRNWYVTVYVHTMNGTRKAITRSVSSRKSDATQLEGRLLADRGDGARVSIKKISMKDACKEFCDWCDLRVAEGAMAESTALYYQKRIKKHVVPNWGKLKLVDFAADAEHYIDQHKARRIGQVKPATINREIATVKRLMSWAHRKKYINVNTLSNYELLTENNQRERVLTRDEIKRLIDAAKGHARMAIIIALNTGLRIEGVLTLKWQEIDLKRGEIVKVVKHQRRAGKKEVRIPLNDTLRKELIEWRNSRPISISGYVIPSPRNPKDHIRITSDFGFRKACKDAGIEDFTFHDLRHTFATYFLLTTKNLHVLAEILGHSPQEEYRMSRRYAHILSDEKRTEMEKFGY